MLTAQVVLDLDQVRLLWNTEEGGDKGKRYGFSTCLSRLFLPSVFYRRDGIDPSLNSYTIYGDFSILLCLTPNDFIWS